MFESRCHLPICLPHKTLTLLIAELQTGITVNTSFYSLWFDPTGNRIRVYHFSSRRSIHSTTDLIGRRAIRVLLKRRGLNQRVKLLLEKCHK